MADREVRLRYIITDEGTIRVLDQAGNKLRELSAVAEETSTRGAAGFSRFQASLVTSVIAIEAVVRAGRAALGFAREFIDAASEQERAVGLLNAQLRTAGQFSEGYSARLQAQASVLQQLTATGDETILGIQRQLIAFGATEDQLGTLVPRVLDLSVALGRNTQGAVVALGKALQGEFGSFAKLGIQIDENATQAEKMGQALAGLGKFAGAAEADAASFEGRVRGLNLQLGEVAEEIGNVIVKSDAMGGILNTVTGRVSDVAGEIAGWVDANRGLIDQKITDTFERIDAIDWRNVATGIGNTAGAVASLALQTGELAAKAASLASKAPPGFLESILPGVAGAALGPVGAVAGLGFGFQSFVNRGEAASRARINQSLRGIGVGVRAPLPASEADALMREAVAAAPSVAPLIEGIESDRPKRDAEADRASAKAAAKELDLLEKSRLATAESRIVVEDAALEVVKAEAAAFDDTRATAESLARTESERFAALAESYTGRLAFARQIDTAEQRILDTEIATLQVKQKEKDITQGERTLIDAQVGQLRTQRDLIGGIGGEAAKVTREYERQVAELEASRRVVVDLGQEINTGLRRAVDGLFASGDSFDLGDIAKDVGTSIASNIVGGFIEAELAKDQFDLMLSENFTVTIPGFVAEGMDAVLGIFGGSLDTMVDQSGTQTDAIGRNFGNAFQSINNAASQTAAFLGGTFRNIGGGAPTLDVFGRVSALAGAAPAVGGTIEDAFGVKFGGAGSGKFVTSSGATVASAGSGLGGALGAAGAVATVAFAVAEQVQAFREGFKEAGELAFKRGESTQSLTAHAFSKDLTGKFFSQIFGKKVGGDINQSFLTGGFASDSTQSRVVRSFVAPGSGAIDLPFNLFQPKTGGTITKAELDRLFTENNLPRQREIQRGDRFGVRTQYLELPPDEAAAQALIALGFKPTDVGTPLEQGDGDKREIFNRITANAAPGVGGLRTGAAVGLFSVLFDDPRQIANATNAAVGNFELLGISAAEAERQLLKIADATGVTLVGGLEELNRKFLEGELNADILKAGGQGLVELFENDLPAGIDVAALAVEHFAEKGGLDIANLTEELEKQVQLFGALEGAVDAAFGSSITTGIEGFRATRQLLEEQLRGDGGVTPGDVLRQADRAQANARVTLGQGLISGLQEAFTQNIFNTIDQPGGPLDLLKDVVAASVDGGTTRDIPRLVDQLLGEAIPAMITSAEVLEEINRQFGELDDDLKNLQLAEQFRNDFVSGAGSALGNLVPILIDFTRQVRPLVGQSPQEISRQVGGPLRNFREGSFSFAQETLSSSLLSAVTNKFIQGFEELPILHDLFDAIAGGNLGSIDLSDALADLMEQAGPLIFDLTESLDSLDRTLTTTPTSLRASAAGIREQVDAALLSGSDRTTQRVLVQEQIDEVAAAVARLRGDTVADTEQAAQFKTLFERQAGLGLTLADVGSQGLLPGTQRFRESRNQGFGLALGAAGELDALASSIVNPMDANTTAIEKIRVPIQTVNETSIELTESTRANTAAVEANTAAIKDLTKSGIVVTKVSGGEYSGTPTISDERLAAALSSPVPRAAVLEIVRGA